MTKGRKPCRRAHVHRRTGGGKRSWLQEEDEEEEEVAEEAEEAEKNEDEEEEG